MSDRSPNFIVSSDDNLMFYNGQAVIGHSEKEMVFVKKLMASSVFWYYIATTSKPYTSNYYSLNGNYIKNFGICKLTQTELDFVIKEQNIDALNKFFEKKYDINFKEVTSI